ncbi:MAG: cytochrome c oxidase subunit II [candidate division WOR-3 bacterium]|jgi:cytochrome c oxidase subunit 2
MNAEKLALNLASIVLLIFFALILYGAYVKNIDLPTCIVNVKPFDKERVVQVSENKYEIYYIARQFSFFPTEVKIPRNSTVDIYLTSPDVTHGFHIEGTNVNLMAIPGAVTYYRVKFKEPGKYRIVCHEYCGLGHQNMMSWIIVE